MIRKHSNSLLPILAVLSITVSALAIPVRAAPVATVAAAADQPLMQAALTDLNNAQKSLRRAAADKGGHRGNAMKLVSQAITEVNAGIAYANRNQSDFDESSLAAVDQGNMESAKNSLQSALGELQNAAAGKGGHRERAMDLVRQAIDEVQAGMDYAAHH